MMGIFLTVQNRPFFMSVNGAQTKVLHAFVNKSYYFDENNIYKFRILSIGHVTYLKRKINHLLTETKYQNISTCLLSLVIF